ncbi:hypothetical protein QBC34DRAFT_375069 [Podospora aff. communis PSN243]|uniref:Uncharacterized protein n=1 Tax=Podospora aff. communis PSN243 TaxID=3040156 RepID=A0AAV9H3W7_9PEZI|nr:hypothetical protein QBC34DRAFT_375069 [Podospora aff. communis PSN243]
MDSPVSPQPSSTGLVHAELRTSWPTWPTAQMLENDTPKATTPFHEASDMDFFDDPMPPKKKKREDPLERILAAAGFESEPERERETRSWSPPSVEEIGKSLQRPPNVISRKGKTSDRVSASTRDRGEAHNRRHIDISISRSTHPEEFHKSAPERKRWTKLAAEGIQSLAQQSVSAPAKSRKRKAQDVPTSEQPVDGRSQSKRKSQRSQKTQPPESQHTLRSNVHSAELHSRHEGDNDLKRADATHFQEVIEIDEVELIAEFSREGSQGNAMGSTPPSRCQPPEPVSDSNREFLQEGAAGGAIEDDSAPEDADERLIREVIQGISDAAVTSDNLPAEQLEADFELPHQQLVPKQSGRDSAVSHQEYDQKVLVPSGDERLFNTSGQIFSSTDIQPANMSSSVGNALGKGIGYNTAQPYAVGQKNTSEIEHLQGSRLGYLATCPLESSLPSRSESNSITNLGISFGPAQGTRHAAPEAVWKQAIADDSPPIVLRNIVSILHRSLKSKEDAIDDIAKEYHENALKLIKKLRYRHSLEKAESIEAHEKASRDILSAFAAAERDMKELTKEVKGLGLVEAEATVRHPGFIKKLGLICQLYEEKSKKPMPMAADKKGNEDSEDEQDELLVVEFQAKLGQGLMDAESGTERELEELYAKAQTLLRGSALCVEKHPRRKAVQDTSKQPKNTFYDVMEGMFDSMINEMQQPPTNVHSVNAGRRDNGAGDDRVSSGEVCNLDSLRG